MPATDGNAVFAGGCTVAAGAVTTAEAALVSVADPPPFVAVTTTR